MYASAERLRHAWGVHAVYVTTVTPGVVELRLHRTIPHQLILDSTTWSEPSV
ncbi:hypothetical protein [Streptomyces sp. NPDC054837]